MQGGSDSSVGGAASVVVLVSLKALNAGDPDGALKHYADDAECKLTGLSSPRQPDVVIGKEQLRAWFQDLVSQHLQVEVVRLAREDDIVTAEILIWSDLARQVGAAPLSATDRYLIRHGKIQSLGRAIHPESAAKLLAALTHIHD